MFVLFRCVDIFVDMLITRLSICKFTWQYILRYMREGCCCITSAENTANLTCKCIVVMNCFVKVIMAFHLHCECLLVRAKGPVSVITVCTTELGSNSLYISSLPGQVEPGTTWNGDGTAHPHHLMKVTQLNW